MPVEVKSSGYKSHKSLTRFIEKYSARVTDPMILYTKDYRREGGIDCVPVYMAGLIQVIA